MPLNRQVLDPGYVLRQFPDMEFGVDDFRHRLRVQKFVYLLQSFDIYLGYDYTWYLHGPYCTTLATMAKALSPIYDKIPCDPGMAFVDPAVQERFERFRTFISGRENDNAFLEIAASLHILHKTSGLPRPDIIGRVTAKRKQFKESECDRVWMDMEEWGLMG